MIIDAQSMTYEDTFKKLRDAVAKKHHSSDDLQVFVESNDSEKCLFIKGFAETLLDRKINIQEAEGYYILTVQ